MMDMSELRRTGLAWALADPSLGDKPSSSPTDRVPFRTASSIQLAGFKQV